MEREGGARIKSQNCLKTSWTHPLIHLSVIISIDWYIVREYKQVTATNSGLKSGSEETSMAVCRTSCQRHRKQSRAWNQLLLPETERFFLIFWITPFEFSLGFMQDENAKMDFASHPFGVAFLPAPNIFAISFFGYPVQKCCLDVPDRPRLMRISSSLTLHLRGRTSRAESWFFCLLLFLGFAPKKIILSAWRVCIPMLLVPGSLTLHDANPTDYKVIHGAALRLILTQLTFSRLRL